MEMRKKNKSLFTKQEAEAALQLIHLNSGHPTCPINIHTTNYHQHLHEPVMKIVSKSEKFLQVQEIHDNDENNIMKRKSDGIVSCCSSVTFDLENNCDEDAREADGCKRKKIKKFRSILDLYNVTEPL